MPIGLGASAVANVRSISFRETPQGLYVRVHKSKSSSSGKLKKRLPYNFKQLSKQIQQAKTADAARPVVQKMRTKLSWLYKQLRNGEYGTYEIFAAIIHAASMERIAKRKVRHLEEETSRSCSSAAYVDCSRSGSVGEAADAKVCRGNVQWTFSSQNGSGNPANAPGEDEEIYGKEELEESIKENAEISEEMMQETSRTWCPYFGHLERLPSERSVGMMEEIEELEEELASETMSEMQDMISCAGRDMTEEEIKEMKRKHRNDEERQLTRADLKYLKALFNKLEQEKRSASSAASSFDGNSQGGTDNSFSAESMPDIEMMDSSVGEMIDVAV